MKRKIILALSISVLLICLFAIGISAAEPNYEGEKVTLDDKTVCPLYDTDGNPLVWYITGTDEDGKKSYAYVNASFYDIENPPSSRVDFISTGGQANEWNDITLTVDGVPYAKSTIVVLNMRDAKITSVGKGREGNDATFTFKAMSNCTNLEYLYLNQKTTSVGQESFNGCTSLKYVNFDELTELTSIGAQGFNGCTKLYQGITLDFTNTKLVSTGTNSLRANAAIAAVFPQTFTTLGQETFRECKSMVSITFNGELESIGTAYSFSNCESLESIICPGDGFSIITSIDIEAFLNCKSLKRVDGILKNGTLTIPAGVTTINERTFQNCVGITSVTFASGVTYVGSAMFSGCTSLASVSLPSTITEIKGSAFYSCTSLTSIIIPEGVTAIGNQALMSTKITSLHIPASVKTLGYQVAESTPITSLTFAENSQLTFIDHRAFMNCTSLEGPVILPYGLKEIDYGLFNGCTKLKAVKIPDSVDTYTENKAMFTSCSSLEFVQLSKNVPTIPESMFEGCTALKAISIPEGVTTIGSKALRNCTSLKAIYLPSTLTTLGIVSDGNDKGAFFQSKNIYFVQNEFSVFNGDTLLGESFEMPAKPAVYYMPSSLNFLGNSEFQSCNQLNSYIVFPVGVTSAAGCTQQGTFQGTGNSSSPVTFVFLGDMEEIVIKQQDAGYSNISFIFANPNDVDLNSITLTIASAGTNKLQTNTYMYFCKGNVSYDLSTFVAPNSTTYTVLETDFTKTTNTAETQPHFHSPRLDETKDATCTLPAGSFTYCFCGKLMTSDVVEGSQALGHVSEGANLLLYYPTMIDASGKNVPNYFSNAYHNFVCQREGCGVTVDEEQSGTALFTKKGITVPEDEKATALCHAITANISAIKAYNEYLGEGNAIKYGVVVGKATASGTPVSVNGTAVGDAIVAGFEGTSYSFIQAKITGISNRAQGLYCSAYVIEGDTVTYLYEGTATSTATAISLSNYNPTLPETTVGKED